MNLFDGLQFMRFDQKHKNRRILEINDVSSLRAFSTRNILSWQPYSILLRAIFILLLCTVTLHCSTLSIYYWFLITIIISVQSLNVGSKFLHMISRQKKYLAGSVISFSTQHVSKYLVFNGQPWSILLQTINDGLLNEFITGYLKIC